jgi:MOSC domain-containing protein YiiM
MLTIEHIYVSPGHNYFGRHGQPPGQHALLDVDQAECVAGCGLRGDRFFEYRPDYKGQVTLFAAEVFAELVAAFGLRGAGPAALRRNLIVRGVQDLTTFVGVEFELQGVRLLGTEECRPCYWMDQALAPGAEQWLKGRGGLRCRVLSTGLLRRDGFVARSAA